MQKTQLDPKTTALLLIDPQLDLLHESGVAYDLVGPHAEELGVVRKLRELRDAAVAAGIPVLYSSVSVPAAAYDNWTPRNALETLFGERRMMIEGEGARFHPELEPVDGCIVLDSRTGPSPRSSNLEQWLDASGTQTVMVAGAIANLCLEAHVRDTVDYGKDVILVSDAIAALSPASHEAVVGTCGLLVAETTDAAGAIASMGGTAQ